MRAALSLLMMARPTCGLVVQAPHGLQHLALARQRVPILTAQETAVDEPAPVEPVADQEDPGFYAGFGAAAGLIANPIVVVSLYNVASTGVGLPAGPYGIAGALEGVSFLIITVVIGAAAVSKVKTGSGLPAGPLGLLGLSEGLSFLSLLLALLVFPLRELGVVGNPETAAVNVPEVAEAVRVFVAPYVATLVATVDSLVKEGLGGLSLPAMPELAMPDVSSGFAMPDVSGFAMPDVSGLAMPSIALPEGLPELPKGLPSLPQGLPEMPALPSITLPEGLPELPKEMPSLSSLTTATPPEDCVDGMCS